MADLNPAPANPSPAPASPPATPAASTPAFDVRVEKAPKAPEKDSSTTADLFAQAEKDLAGKPGESTDTREDGQEPEKTGEEKKPDQPARKFKTHEEAESAFEQLQAQFEEFKKTATPPAKPPDEGKKDGEGDGPGEGKDGDDQAELSEEELEILWSEDPASARKYERAQTEKKFKTLLEPFQKVIEDIEFDRQARAETEALSSFQKSFEKENGEGSFQKHSAKIEDAKFLESVFKSNPTTAKAIRALIEKGDKPGVFEILMKEAVSLEKKTNQEKSERSVPPDTGSAAGSSGGRPKNLSGKNVTTEDLFAESEREHNIKAP